MVKHLGYRRRDAKKLETRRSAAIARILHGEAKSKIASSLGVCIQSVQRWARCYRDKGKEGLRSLPKSGPRPKLAPDKLAGLTVLLARGPLTYGFDTPVWTSERIALLIWRQFRVRYSTGYVKRLMKPLGWRWYEHTWLPPNEELKDRKA